MAISLLAILVSAFLAIPSTVMAEVSIYGRAHVSMDVLDDGDDYTELNVSSNASRLGFTAERATERGVIGFMQIEGEITYNQGNSALSNRATFAGLQGGFGMMRVGQFDTPFMEARGPANLFGSQLGEIRNFTRVGSGRFDERTPNTILYQTPDYFGLNVNLAYSVHEGTAARDNRKDSGYSASITFKDGPVDAAVAFEAFEEDADWGKRNAIRAAVGFSLNDRQKVVGFLQNVNHDNDLYDSLVLGAGGSFWVHPETMLKGMLMLRNGDGDDTNSIMVALAGEYYLDAMLRVYANLATVINDDRVNLTPWEQGRTVTKQGVAGKNATGVSLGMVYDFRRW